MTARGLPARRRGVRFEQEVARWLGTVTTRSTRPGIHDDAGDVLLPGFVVETKSHTRLALPAWWRELVAKVDTDDEPVLIVKQAGKTVAHALVYERADDGAMTEPVTLAEWWPQREAS
jgi:hypothetical protein